MEKIINGDITDSTDCACSGSETKREPYPVKRSLSQKSDKIITDNRKVVQIFENFLDKYVNN